jgi:hypothetical protein
MIGSGELCTEAGLGSPDYITRQLLPSVDALEDDDVPFVQKTRSDTQGRAQDARKQDLETWKGALVIVARLAPTTPKVKDCAYLHICAEADQPDADADML